MSESHAEPINVEPELLLNKFRVKAGMEALFEERLAHATGYERLAYEKAFAWVEDVQLRIDAKDPVTVTAAAEASFAKHFNESDIGKTTPSAIRFIAEFWDGDSQALCDVMDKNVRKSYDGIKYSMGGILDHKCPYTDERKAYARPSGFGALGQG